MTNDELIWRIEQAKRSVEYDEQEISKSDKQDSSSGIVGSIGDLLGIPIGTPHVDPTLRVEEYERLAESQRALEKLTDEAERRGIDASRI